jgi:ABC-type phosphate transport system ATPase subunit
MKAIAPEEIEAKARAIAEAVGDVFQLPLPFPRVPFENAIIALTRLVAELQLKVERLEVEADDRAGLIAKIENDHE